MAEYQIEGYKADLFIEDTKTIIEVKSVLSLDETAVFPTVYSERSLVQLKKLNKLLVHGYQCHYCIVSLNPYVKRVRLLEDTAFKSLLKEGMEEGMTVSGWSCHIKNNVLTLKGRLIIE